MAGLRSCRVSVGYERGGFPSGTFPGPPNSSSSGPHLCPQEIGSAQLGHSRVTFPILFHYPK
jgi:hypothetical protein